MDAPTYTPIACMEHARLGLSAVQCDRLHHAEQAYRRALIEHPTPRSAGDIADELLAKLRHHRTRVVVVDAFEQPLTVLDANSNLFERALRAGEVRPTGHEAVFQMTGRP